MFICTKKSPRYLMVDSCLILRLITHKRHISPTTPMVEISTKLLSSL